MEDSTDMNEQNQRYYVKHTMHPADNQPNWIVYERTEIGPRAIALCYREDDALRIARLLTQDESPRLRESRATN